MNRFSLELCYDRAGRQDPDPMADFSDGYLALRQTNLHPALRLYERRRRVIGLLGNPIAAGRRDDQAVLELWDRTSDLRAFLRALNGSFLIFLYSKETRELIVANDRFASLAFYYDNEASGLRAALSAKPLLEARRAAGKLSVDLEAVFEFLYFRRLFGEKTFEPKIRYLTSAALLTLSPDRSEATIEKYWQPNYGLRPSKGRKLVEELAGRLQEAMAMGTSDGRRFALLLSGGLDSRALLAASERPHLCVTTALEHNNEVAVAAEVAATAGAPHHFVPRPADLYDRVLGDAVFLTGGMQVYSEAQFMGYGPEFSPLADSFLIGLGLDIFFGGLYLPKEPRQYLGHQALHHRLLPLSQDLAGDFIGGVKYRLKTSDPFALVKAGARRRLSESLRHAVGEILARGRDLGAERYDLWEYMHLHNLSRHYSFPMMASIRSFADCRAPVLENGLFELAIAMTAEQKLDGTAYQDAITKLNPAIMALNNANTNLRASYSLRKQTAVKALRRLTGRLTGSAYPRSPAWQDRSWPSPKAALNANAKVMESVLDLPASQHLADLDFIAMESLAQMVEEHRAGRQDHAICLNVLLTIDRFLTPEPEAALALPKRREAGQDSQQTPASLP